MGGKQQISAAECCVAAVKLIDALHHRSGIGPSRPVVAMGLSELREQLSGAYNAPETRPELVKSGLHRLAVIEKVLGDKGIERLACLSTKEGIHAQIDEVRQVAAPYMKMDKHELAHEINQKIIQPALATPIVAKGAAAADLIKYEKVNAYRSYVCSEQFVSDAAKLLKQDLPHLVAEAALRGRAAVQYGGVCLTVEYDAAKAIVGDAWRKGRAEQPEVRSLGALRGLASVLASEIHAGLHERLVEEHRLDVRIAGFVGQLRVRLQVLRCSLTGAPSPALPGLQGEEEQQQQEEVEGEADQQEEDETAQPLDAAAKWRTLSRIRGLFGYGTAEAAAATTPAIPTISADSQDAQEAEVGAEDSEAAEEEPSPAGGGSLRSPGLTPKAMLRSGVVALMAVSPLLVAASAEAAAAAGSLSM